MTAEVLVEKKKLAKPPLEIYHLGDRVLRQPAKRVAKVDVEIKQLIREMLQTMVLGWLRPRLRFINS
jgi:peptide deformylase